MQEWQHLARQWAMAHTRTPSPSARLFSRIFTLSLGPKLKSWTCNAASTVGVCCVQPRTLTAVRLSRGDTPCTDLAAAGQRAAAGSDDNAGAARHLLVLCMHPCRFESPGLCRESCTGQARLRSWALTGEVVQEGGDYIHGACEPGLCRQAAHACLGCTCGSSSSGS